MARIRLRFFWLITLVTVALVALCTITAVSLFREQARIAWVLRESVVSRRTAVELEECLNGLIAQEKVSAESVSALNSRASSHLQALAEYADQPAEQELYKNMAASYDEYLLEWSMIPPRNRPGHDAALQKAIHLLDTKVRRPCQEFWEYNNVLLERSTRQHEQVLGQLGWGMALIGGLGGFAGLVLGFGVARGLSRSIHRLQVQILDAAGKLGPAVPPVVLTRVGDFDELHELVNQLSTRIEAVVQELQQRELEVLRAEQLAAVGQLAAGVAHEIRNPLTSIKMLVQLAIEEESSLSHDDWNIIEGEVRKMEHSLQTFLSFARPPKPERRRVDLHDVLRTVLGLVRGRAEKQQVTLDVAAPAEPLILVADAGQLQQVLVNLMLNALDAMPSGGRSIITVRKLGDHLQIEVADNGSGIPPDMMPRLFRPFASGKDTGLGLGLVISQRITEDHGGTLTAANRPGGGAIFTVSLPVGLG
jgi:signal transduction histidine kinase